MKDLLTVLTAGRDLPEGFDTWGIKSVRPDLTTKHGYQWPFPGGVARVDGMLDHDGSCPRQRGDGLCVATDWRGMASSGIPALTLLLVAYNGSAARGDEPGKWRCPAVAVVALVDGARLVREYGAGANLSGADLSGANLSRANLTRTHLTGANLTEAHLTRANLTGANLSRADLTRAYLSGAYLTGAYLSGAYLTGADLSGATLTGTDLTRTHLTRTNLTEADLTRTNLTGTNLTETVGVES